MNSSSLRRFAGFLLIGFCSLAVSSCGQVPVATAVKPAVETVKEPTLDIGSSQIIFRKGEQFSLTLKIYSPEDSNVQIGLGAAKNLALDQQEIQVAIAAGETKTLELRGTPKRSGYYNITANAVSKQWSEPAADMFGFNVASDDTNIASVGDYAQLSTGPESLETHLDQMPKITTPEEYAALNTAQVIDDFKDTDRVRLDSRLDNMQFAKRDGVKTEPLNTVMSYLPDSGSGQPSAKDLEPPSAVKTQGLVRPQGFCGLGAWAMVTANISYNGKTLALPFTKIYVFDENPWLSPSPVASGFTDATGNYWFQKPGCDWGAWWDYSGPDLYFVVETLDSHEIGVNNILAPIYVNTYSVRTGTNWDTNATYFNVNLTAGNSDSENAMWLYRMVQAAQEFNVGAGGGGATYFPIRIAWPSRIPFSDWANGTSFALVSKMEIRGEHWFYPYIAWHEFGHNMLYRTANPSAYQLAYSLGPFSISIPLFAFGPHSVSAQQNVELAYNEGFANYLFVMLQDHYGITFNPWLDDNYYLRSCNFYPNCLAFSDGNQNESRVSTFLYRYTREVLSPSNATSAQAAYGLIRSRLWYSGYYNTSFAAAWSNWISQTLPIGGKIATNNIAVSTGFSLTGLQ